MFSSQAFFRNLSSCAIKSLALWSYSIWSKPNSSRMCQAGQRAKKVNGSERLPYKKGTTALFALMAISNPSNNLLYTYIGLHLRCVTALATSKTCSIQDILDEIYLCRCNTCCFSGNSSNIHCSVICFKAIFDVVLATSFTYNILIYTKQH